MPKTPLFPTVSNVFMTVSNAFLTVTATVS